MNKAFFNFLSVCILSLLGSVAFAEISVNVNGTTYECQGTANSYRFGCECEDTGNDLYRLNYNRYSISEGSFTTIKLLRVVEGSSATCLAEIAKQPLCR